MSDLPPGFRLEDAAPPPAGGLPPGFRLEEPQRAEGPSQARRFAMGLGDPLHGGAQFVANSMPTSVVDAINNAAAWVNRQPVVGPVTRALGMTPATPQQLNQQVQQRERAYQAERTAAGETGTDWTRMAGNLVPSIALGGRLPVGASLPGAVAAGAGSGAVMSAAEPVTQGDYWSEKENQLLGGALIGAGAGGVGHLIGRGIAGVNNPTAQRLRDEGVQLTPGQALGGNYRRLEDRLSSLPVVGDSIRNAQNASLDSFNRAVANRTLAPIGESVAENSPVGRELVRDVNQRISNAYTQAYGQIRPFGPDQQFAQDLATAVGGFLQPDARRVFQREMGNDILSRIQSGQMNGQTYQQVRQELNRLAREFEGHNTLAGRELSTAFDNVGNAFNGLLQRSNPQVAPALDAADTAWANFVRMRAASSAPGTAGREGVFTAPQLSSAVTRNDRSVGRGATARGQALMQDLSDAGAAVLPSTVPNSGTPERLLAAALLGGQFGVPAPAAAAGAGIYGMYTEPARRAIAAALLAHRSPGVQAAGNALTGGAVAAPVVSALMAP